MTPPHFRVLALSFGVWLLLGSCSDSPQEPALEECPGDQVSVSVSAGSTPLFTWAPRCGVSSLNIFPSAGGPSLWVFYSREEGNPFRSGIRYGRAPVAALEVTGPVPLVSDTEYTVIVYRSVGDPGGPTALLQAGTATFQP